MKKWDSEISSMIWEKKYKYQGSPDIPADKSIEDTWNRIAVAVSAHEKNSARTKREFLEILEGFRFLPGGRIIANAGTARSSVTMFNCYVMNTIEDSIEGIFDSVKEAAVTQKQGGGVGFDFSTLRPSGSPIKGCEAHSSGPISFMQVFDSTCRTIMSAGQRRGAQMAVLRCDHPDIEEFITAKRNNQKLHMFNLSVGITEKFIRAVRENGTWDLVFRNHTYKTINAAALWELIMRSAYDFAEPGFILLDRINKMNNLHYCETICATNPCGEQPLPPYGACLLGSLNLTQFISAPFTKQAKVKYSELESVTRKAVRFLDNVIDISKFPLESQRKEAFSKRRMGIGITGLADALIFLGIRYGSPESTKIASDIMRTITHAAYETSVSLGSEKGVFPAFDTTGYSSGNFIGTLPKELQKTIKAKGLRNSHLTSIAPTGTISLLAGNISSGLEPVFAFSYKRKVRNGHESDSAVHEVNDYAFMKYMEFIKAKQHPEKLPDYIVTSDETTPHEHIEIQAALQEFVDSSISKTINIPADFPFEEFKNIYMTAYEKGLKGCTTFRPSEHMSGILVKEASKEDKKSEKTAPHEIKQISRPIELEGITYKIKTPLSSEAIYLTINDIMDENGVRRPYELFINTKNLQHFSWIVAMTRLISAVFRKEPDPSFLVDELKSIYDPNGGYFSEGRYVPSLAADIGLVIEKHLKKIGFIKDGQNGKTEKANEFGVDPSKLMICPQCNNKTLYSQENCFKCLNCSYSKCE